MNNVARNRLISVVDDDESVRSGTASLLRAAGYATESFGSVEEFLRSGNPRRFACVVSDIQMPGMSGIELANQLGHGDAPIPVILVTARTEKEVLGNATQSRASFLLRKPFTADQLLMCVASVVR